jgi:glycosyltransferase involved in cell wall biosynthesis
MARVSVIIPAHNAEAYIEETIRSALAQTHADLEIIVVDDGSTDRTAERVRAFGDRLVLRVQPNAGVAAARNTGARLATGEWLAFLDADDLWEPEKTERQLLSSDAPMTYTDRFNIGAKGDLPDVQSQVTPMHEGDLFVPLLLEGNFITASSVMLKANVFHSVDGFFTGLSGTADWDLAVRVAAEHRIGFCDEPLVRYRFHPAGMSRDYRRMWVQRHTVVARALALPRGKALSWTTRRRAWAHTWITNAWEAGQAGQLGTAVLAYGRSARWWPVDRRPYKETLKLWIPLAARLRSGGRT